MERDRKERLEERRKKGFQRKMDEVEFLKEGKEGQVEGTLLPKLCTA